MFIKKHQIPPFQRLKCFFCVEHFRINIVKYSSSFFIGNRKFLIERRAISKECNDDFQIS